MKAKSIIGWFIIIAAGLYFFLYLPWRAAEEKKQRAELHLLNTLDGQIHAHLDAGGALPTNWPGVSNAVNWELIVKICEHNGLRPATELYTVLPRPVRMDIPQLTVFLVRTESRRWPARERGRWVMGRGSRPLEYRHSPSDTNHVDRHWIPEQYLPPEILSQLPRRD